MSGRQSRRIRLKRGRREEDGASHVVSDVHTWGDGGNPERTDWRVCSHGIIIIYICYM